MILWNERLGEYALEGTNRSVRGISLGSSGPGQHRFIIPVKSHRDEPINPEAWGVRPTMSGKPQIAANWDTREGVLARLSTFNRLDNRIGRIYLVAIHPLGDILVLGYGSGGTLDNSVRYEEAMVQIMGRALFYLQNVGPPDTLITINGKEVVTEHISPEEAADRIGGELVRVDDPRLPRWKRRPPDPVRP